MPSQVDNCNAALSHVGSDTVVVSIDPPDGSVESGYCASFYPIARAEALEMHPWTWAKTRAALAQVANDSTTWAYAYALPSQCLTPLRVLQQQIVADYLTWPLTSYQTNDDLVWFTERGSAEFQIEGKVLRTNEPDAVLLYVQDVTTAGAASGMFNAGFGYLLASYLAGPIVKGQAGANASATLRQAGLRLLGQAAAADANKSSERAAHIPEHIAARL